MMRSAGLVRSARGRRCVGRRRLALGVVVATTAAAATFAGAALAPAAAQTMTEPRMDVVTVIGTDGQLWFSQSRDRRWYPLGGRLVDTPAVVHSGGHTYFVGLGGDRNVWVRTLDRPWAALGPAGTSCTAPAAAVSRGILAVACTGSDAGLWAGKVALPAAGALPRLGGWQGLGGILRAGPSLYDASGSSTSAQFGYGVLGADGRPWVRTDGTGWAMRSPHACGGTVAASQRAEVLSCRDSTSESLKTFHAASGRDGQLVAGRITGRPAIAADTGGAARHYALGVDGTVWTARQQPDGSLSGFSHWGGAGVHGVGATTLPLSSFGVTLDAPGTASPGSAFALTGAVTPAAPGRTVVLQRQSGGVWQDRASGILTATSTFRFDVSEPVHGTVPYRVVAAASPLVDAGTSPTRPVAVTSAGLKQGQRLNPGAFLQSGSGQYRLTMQTDGNLVQSVVGSGRVLWASGTGGNAGATALMQADGNLVVYLHGVAKWSTRTGGNPDTGRRVAVLQDDANLVVYDGSTPTWSSATRNTRVAVGESLRSGWFVQSPDGHYRLTLQADGNLVERVAETSRPVWSSGTANRPGAHLVQQADGNAVIYAGSTAVWATSTSGTGASLALQNDANVVQYVSGSARWASSTVNDKLMPGERLYGGQFIDSADGAYRLVQQGDGNLVHYRGGTAVWASGSTGHSGAFTVMQSDGNLVVYTGGTARWASGTGGRTGAHLANQTDGNLVLYQGSTAVWASRSASAGGQSTPELVPFVGSYRITATWGSPSGGYHPASSPAIDVAMPIGTPLYAAGAGTVVEAIVDRRHCDPRNYPNYVQGCYDAGYGGSGVRVRIAHPDGRRSYYQHMDSIEGSIVKGASVRAGQRIGTSGNTGISEGPHLHYQEENSSGGLIDPGSWIACHGSSKVVYDGMQHRKGQTIRNDGYAC